MQRKTFFQVGILATFLGVLLLFTNMTPLLLQEDFTPEELRKLAPTNRGCIISTLQCPNNPGLADRDFMDPMGEKNPQIYLDPSTCLSQALYYVKTCHTPGKTETMDNQGAVKASFVYDGKVVAHLTQVIPHYAMKLVPRNPATLSCTFDGKTIANGSAVKAFFDKVAGAATGADCKAELRQCKDGVLLGSAPYSSCTYLANCMFDGRVLAHGQSVRAFKAPYASDPRLCTASSEIRLCTNGVLSGTYTYGACVVGKSIGPKPPILPNPASMACNFNGRAVPAGSVITAYFQPKAVAGPKGGDPVCTSEPRKCVNGKLTGSAPYAQCAVPRI